MRVNGLEKEVSQSFIQGVKAWQICNSLSHFSLLSFIFIFIFKFVVIFTYLLLDSEEFTKKPCRNKE